MNFWTFEEDHSHGYYDPVPRRRYPGSSALLLTSLLYLVRQLLRLAGNIIWGTLYLLLLLLRFAWKKATKK